MDSEAARRAWADRTGEFSPDYYAHHGPDEKSEAVARRLDEAVGADASVLELGCSAGRHLAHLYANGYRDLHGIDVNAEAGPVLRQAYPALWRAGTFTFDAMQDVVTGYEDGRFDAVYSVETLQHLPPDDDWVFAEVARVADELVVTLELEDGPAVSYVDDGVPLYRRDWGEVFTGLGLEQVASERVGKGRLRAFSPA